MTRSESRNQSRSRPACAELRCGEMYGYTLSITRDEERSALEELTRREREILQQIAEGKSNAAIAQSLVLTKRAVEKHVNSIFAKLGLRSSDAISCRVTAALLFLADGQSRPARERLDSARRL
jgi:DNA-binding NarL/FixJ family response regulator